ncbi:MAG: hypothetical protein CMK00_01725 [Planctomycetes bacterium]|nr:hypothetical protein [Planctomycetota bacterium]
MARSSDGHRDLIGRALNGSTAAREQLLHLCTPELSRFVARSMGGHLKRAYSVEDICQDTFLRALGALDALPSGADYNDFRGVLYQHAHWVLARKGRQAGLFRGESAGDADRVEARANATEGEVTRADERAYLGAAVARLTPDLARVVRLRLDGLSFSEIAKATATPEGTLRKRFMRASKAIRKDLRNFGNSSPSV